MTIVKMQMKRNLMIILAVLLATLVLFFDVASLSAFKGGPSPDRHGSGYYRADPGPRSYRAGPPPGNYRGDRRNDRVEPGPRNYRSYPSPGYYRGDRAPGPGPGYYRNQGGPGYYPERSQRFYRGQPFSPYGGPQRGGYGERRAIQSRGDAQRMLNDYYMKRNMRIGPIRENKFYYEADILDRDNRFMDRVIIDKRSGRIRSIY